MEKDKRIFVKLTPDAEEYYRRSPKCSGYEPLKDDVGISMMDFDSYNELTIELHRRLALSGVHDGVEFFDETFGIHSGAYDIFINHSGKIEYVVPQTKPLYPDELADQLGRSRSYVHAMRKAGFPMPGNLASITEAKTWLHAHSEFTTKGYAA